MLGHAACGAVLSWTTRRLLIPRAMGLVANLFKAALTFGVLLALVWLRNTLRLRGRPRAFAAVPVLVGLLLLVPVFLITRVTLGLATMSSGGWPPAVDVLQGVRTWH